MSVLLAVAAFIVSLFLTKRFLDPASRFYILDRPNDRSLHTHPTPRGGGLAILLAIIICSLGSIFWFGQFPEPAYRWVAGAGFLVAAVSYLDDRFILTSAVRFIVHILAAVLVAFAGLVVNRLELPGLVFSLPYWIDVIFTILFVVWMLNLYNFMDGMDGLAGGMTVFGFGAFATMGWMEGHEIFFAVNLIVAAASAGFMVFNFPPARIFMGDVGSSTLGFLAAVFSLWGVRDGVFSFWVAVLVFSPFFADATVTLLRRLWRREKIWKPHKSHYYQRLVQSGWGHRKTVLAEYLIMFGCGLTAVIGMYETVVMQAAMLSGWVLFYIIFFFWVSWHASRHRHDPA